MNKFFLGIALLISAQAMASMGNVHSIRALGASKKGQFIAVEEYGYNAGMRTSYSRIKFMNMWNKKEQGPVVEIEERGTDPAALNKVRSKALTEANEHFAKYKIILST